MTAHILASAAFQPTETERFQWGLDRLLDGLAAHANDEEA
jgi:hypothetical protein